MVSAISILFSRRSYSNGAERRKHQT